MIEDYAAIKLNLKRFSIISWVFSQYIPENKNRIQDCIYYKIHAKEEADNG